MKTIIAGSRTIQDYNAVEQAVKASGFEISEVVSGGAGGVDTQAIRYARMNAKPGKIFFAQWIVNERYDKGAGYKRNVEMADYAEALIAVWDGKSGGTKHMIDTATKKGLKVYVHEVLS